MLLEVEDYLRIGKKPKQQDLNSLSNANWVLPKSARSWGAYEDTRKGAFPWSTELQRQMILGVNGL